MATPVLIPVLEYLNTSYDPDCDYINGEVIERNVGEKQHGILQGILFATFRANMKHWNLLPVVEQRVQISKSKFRIPDFCAVRRAQSADPIVHVPPVLCVEILSRDQTLSDMTDRTRDYLAMGVENVWIFDPLLHKTWIGKIEGFEPFDGTILEIPATPVQLNLAEMFAELDDLLSGRW
jgi:Uma2 family endonuclease